MGGTSDSGDLLLEGAWQHNLKNLTLRIPHDALTVITGVSGSGKSSLAFETLFAEGQWRYVESLSAYTRMFLERVSRPAIDRLVNIRPAIALEQKNPVRTARSTVGTSSEIADYLRLLFAKIGRITCPDCALEARVDRPEAAADALIEHFPGERILVAFPLNPPEDLPKADLAATLLKRGFIRLQCGDQVVNLSTDPWPEASGPHPLRVVVDRLVLRDDQRLRLVDSLETAFQEGGGIAHAQVLGRSALTYRTTPHCPGCGRSFEPVRPVLFSFNHPLGACPECKGFGNTLHYDEGLIVPDGRKSLRDGAIEPWTTPSNQWWQEQLLRGLRRKRIDVAKPYDELSEEERRIVWEGEGRMEGIHQFFEYLEGKRYKMHVRVFLSRYRRPRPCPACGGSRLRPEARFVKIGGHDIAHVSQWTVGAVETWLRSLSLSPQESEIAQDLIHTLCSKLALLVRMGLDYLTLHRETRTLSGGETQRIALATQLGARLVGTLYVLDEPTVGLHPRDTAPLADLLRELAAQGNTVVVVEHDPLLIQRADYVVELGPGAGEKGGELICSAPYPQFLLDRRSVTARYLRGEEQIPLPSSRRPGNGKALLLRGAKTHNLKHLTVRLPLGLFTCITGVSGSGKSTLVTETLYPAVAQTLRLRAGLTAPIDSLAGVEHLRSVRLIDQDPIGRTPRSNPVTYMKAFDAIRRLFADTPEAKLRGLGPAHFSFNTGTGRCPRCQGQGYEKLEMYFFEDLYVTCEACQGRRYTPEVLAVRVRGYSLHDVLTMTVEQALAVLGDLDPALRRPLLVLDSLGLGYLRLGQPAPSLSGGESQRLKIAAELARALDRRDPVDEARGILYILDEPTTGLHLEDIHKLLRILARLVDAGHTVLVVEHHLEVIKCADWVIDLGPGAGEAGGTIVAEGSPEAVAAEPSSHTGRFLRPLLRPTSSSRQ